MNTEDLYDHDASNKTITLFKDLNYWSSYHAREFLIINHYELFLYSMNKSSYKFVNLPDNYIELFHKTGIIDSYYDMSYLYMVRDEIHSVLGIFRNSHAQELLNIIFDVYYNSSDWMNNIVLDDDKIIAVYYNNYPDVLRIAYRQQAAMTGTHKALMQLLNMTEIEFFKDIPKENLLGIKL